MKTSRFLRFLGVFAVLIFGAVGASHAARYHIALDDAGASYSSQLNSNEYYHLFSSGSCYYLDTYPVGSVTSPMCLSDDYQMYRLPAKEGYDFLGYYYYPSGNTNGVLVISQSGNILVSNIGYISSNVTIYARWEPKSGSSCSPGYIWSDGWCMVCSGHNQWQVCPDGVTASSCVAAGVSSQYSYAAPGNTSSNMCYKTCGCVTPVCTTDNRQGCVWDSPAGSNGRVYYGLSGDFDSLPQSVKSLIRDWINPTTSNQLCVNALPNIGESWEDFYDRLSFEDISTCRLTSCPEGYVINPTSNTCIKVPTRCSDTEAYNAGYTLAYLDASAPNGQKCYKICDNGCSKFNWEDEIYGIRLYDISTSNTTLSFYNDVGDGFNACTNSVGAAYCPSGFNVNAGSGLSLSVKNVNFYENVSSPSLVGTRKIQRASLNGGGDGYMWFVAGPAEHYGAEGGYRIVYIKQDPPFPDGITASNFYTYFDGYYTRSGNSWGTKLVETNLDSKGYPNNSNNSNSLAVFNAAGNNSSINLYLRGISNKSQIGFYCNNSASSPFTTYNGDVLEGQTFNVTSTHVNGANTACSEHTSEGRTLTGWRIDCVNYGTDTNLTTTTGSFAWSCAGQVRIEAQWQSSSYSITYKPGYTGATQSPQTVSNIAYNSTFTTLSGTAFTRSGYIMTGWNDSVFSGLSTQYTYNRQSNTELDAVWTQCECEPGNGVASCTPGSNSSNQCIATATCSSGYTNPQTSCTGASCSSWCSVATTYTITYQPNYSGATQANQTQSVIGGNAFYTKPGTTFLRSGYIMTAWSNPFPRLAYRYSSYNQSSNTTLNAQWEECVCVEDKEEEIKEPLGGGEEVVDPLVSCTATSTADNICLMEVVCIDGYHQHGVGDGESDCKNGLCPCDGPNCTPECIPNQYNVTYDCTLGEPMMLPYPVDSVEHGDAYMVRANFCDSPDAQFDGWDLYLGSTNLGSYTAPGSINPWNIVAPNGSTFVFKAKWIGNYCAYNYSCGAGTIASGATMSYIIDVGQSHTIQPGSLCVPPTGQAFSSWSVGAPNGTLNCTTAGTIVDITPVYGPAQYSVKYVCGDGATGTPPDGNITATYGATYTPSANTCSKSGFIFAGWEVSNTGQYPDVQSPGIGFTWGYLEDKMFTAKWEECPQGYHASGDSCVGNTVTIMYDRNGHGAAVSANTTCTIGGTANLAAALIETGWTFDGWSLNSIVRAGGAQINCNMATLGTVTDGASVTATAQWTAKQTCTYVYSCGDHGTGGTTAQVYEGDTYTVVGPNGICTPDAGYIFNDWTPHSVNATLSCTKSTGTVNLTATWTADGQCTYTYGCGDHGTVKSGATTTATAYVNGSPHTHEVQSISAVCDIDAGWTASTWDNGTPGGTLTCNSAGSTPLAPVYSANSITIDWDENGGSAISQNGSCSYETTTFDVPSAGATTKAGYILTGWKLNGVATSVAPGTTGNVCNYTNLGVYSGTSNNVVAQWAQCTCTTGTGASGCTPTVSNNQCDGTVTCSDGFSGGSVACDGASCVATCAANKYTIEYSCVDKNGDGSGTAPTGGSVTHGDPYSVLANTGCTNSAPGVTFGGWELYQGATLKGTYTSLPYAINSWDYAAASGATFTFKAIWSQSGACAHTYSCGDYASGFGTSVTTYVSGTPHTYTTPQVSICTMNPGYSATQWKNAATGTAWTPDVTFTCTSEQTVNFVPDVSANTVTIQYNNGGHGTAPSSTTCNYGQNFNLAPAISDGGAAYSFDKWSVNGASYSPGASIGCDYTTLGSEPIVITAQWNDVSTCTYTYNCGSGTGSYSTTIYEGQSHTVLAGSQVCTDPAGYTFSNWTPNNAGAVLTCTKDTSAVTLTANYNPNKYTVTYACGTGATGTPPSGESVTYNTTYTPLAHTGCAKAGSRFDGWAVSGTNDVKAENVGFTWLYTENKTFTATWVSCGAGQHPDSTYTTCENDEYNIVYSCGNVSTGGNPPNGGTVTYGGSHTVAQNPAVDGCEYTGHTFLGWKLSTGDDYDVGDVINPWNHAAANGATFTFTARWSGVNSYKITYKPGYQSATEPDQVQSVQYGASFATKPGTTFTRQGFVMTGWTNPFPLLEHSYEYNIANDTELQAKWSACQATGYGTGVDSCIAGSNNNNECTATATCLAGYYNGAGSCNGTSCSCSCDPDPSQNTITYNTYNGDWESGAVHPNTYTPGSAQTYNAYLTRAHSTHTGWCRNADLTQNCTTNKTVQILATDVGTKNFYAKWECDTGYELNTGRTACVAKGFKVVYDCGLGTGTAPVDSVGATYAATYTPKANTCSKDGSIFAGWLVSGTSDVKQPGSGFTWMYTETKTFTAQWTACGVGQHPDATYTTCENNQYIIEYSCGDSPAGGTAPGGGTIEHGASYTVAQNTGCVYYGRVLQRWDVYNGNNYVTSYNPGTSINSWSHTASNGSTFTFKAYWVSCPNGTAYYKGECLDVCDAGVTIMKTSQGLDFTLFRTKETTPALNLKYNNKVCYVPLEQGNGGHNKLNLRDHKGNSYYAEPNL